MTLLQTATNIILHILQKPDVKNISIYDKNQNQKILTNLRFLDGSGQIDKKLMEHPKEDGTLITDHIVNDPTQIILQVLISDDDSSSLNIIQDLYEKSTPVIIKLKNELHDNLVMVSKPLKVDVDHFNNTVYNLTFKEVQEAVTLYVKMSVPQVKQKKNTSKVNTGHKQARISAAAMIKKKIGL